MDRDGYRRRARKLAHGDFNPRGPCGPRPPVSKTSVSKSYFNPRGPCGPRRYAVNAQFLGSDISILAVLADRDESAGAGGLPFEFQSSRSLRTATKMGKYTVDQIDISILAVLADRDQYTDIDYRMTEISILAVLADRDTL